MTSAMTATSEHSGQTLTRAVAGEKAGMDTGPAPLGPILEEIVKRAELAKDGVWNHIHWSGVIAMAAGGSNSSFTLTIGAIAALVLYNGTRYKTFAYGGGTIGASKISGGGNLANSTRYYVYAYDKAGSLDFQIATDVPNANLSTKNASSQYRYLGTFLTDSSGNPLPFRCVRGRYRYSLTGMPSSINDVRALNGTSSATSWTDVSLSSLVPSYARTVHLRAQVINADNAKTGRAQFRTKGHTSGSIDLDVAEMGGSGTANYNELHFDLECDSNNAIQYQRADSAGTYADIDVFVWVLGWDE